MMTITCHFCQKAIAPADLTIKDRPLRGGGKERRFRCPHCKRWYTVAVFTPTGVRLANEIRQAEAELNRRPTDAALRERLRLLREQLAPEVRAPDAPA